MFPTLQFELNTYSSVHVSYIPYVSYMFLKMLEITSNVKKTWFFVLLEYPHPYYYYFYPAHTYFAIWICKI